MKKSILILFVSACIYACQSNNDKTAQQFTNQVVESHISGQSDFMYQYSLIDALLAGVFDGELSISMLKEKGDFGIGAFNRLNGEMIMLDRTVYRASQSGEVSIVADIEQTPLAFVKFFKTDTALVVPAKSTFEDV